MKKGDVCLSFFYDKEVTSRIASRCYDILDLIEDEEDEEDGPLLDRINGVLGEEYEDLEDAVDVLISEYLEAVG